MKRAFKTKPFIRWNGFEKNVKTNISRQDEDALKLIGAKYLRMDDNLLIVAIVEDQLQEIEL